MLEKKHNKFLAILAVVVLVTIYLLFGKETTLQYKIQDALESHDHESALIFASRLLEKEPGNPEAINVIKESGQIFLYLQMAQAKLPEFSVVENQDTGQVVFYVNTAQSSSADLSNTAENVSVKPEKVYEDFINARAYIDKAKRLDADFKTTLNFEKRLDEAQTFVLKILAANVFDVGTSVYTNVFNNYKKKSALINSAASSEYLKNFLAIQSAWAPMEKPADKVKQKINPLLDKMDNTGLLVSDYKAGKAENLSKSLLDYIQAVKESVDAILVPNGSYADFIKVANTSTSEYMKAKNKLKRALPRSVHADDFSNLVKAVVDYKLFKNDSTIELIKDNQYLQGA